MEPRERKEYFSEERGKNSKIEKNLFLRITIKPTLWRKMFVRIKGNIY